MAAMSGYYRTAEGVLLSAVQAQNYPGDVWPVLDASSQDHRKRALEQHAVKEYRGGKLTRAERCALFALLKRYLSTDEAAARLSCSVPALVRLVMGFRDEILARRVRTVLKPDYLNAIRPRKRTIDSDRFPQAPGAQELRRLIADTRRAMRNEANESQ